jgi:hypothetical protein
MKLFLPPQTILLPSPVLIIGTYGADGRPNIMTASWRGIASIAVFAFSNYNGSPDTSIKSPGIAKK